VVPLFREIRERLKAAPGVRSTGFGFMRMMADNEWGSGITVEGYTPAENDPGPSRNAVGPEYFKTLGIAMVRGREFTERDDENAPKVAVINETFARFYFGGRDALGKRIGPGGRKGAAECTIVGVVQDGKYRTFREPATRMWYVPLAQSPARQGTLYVRTEGDPGSAISLVAKVIASIDKNVALVDPKTVQAQVYEQSRQERLLAALSTFFGVLAAMLATIGLYGVLSFMVSRRAREIGVRMALGAMPGDMARLVLREVAVIGMSGFALGLAAMAMAGGAVESLLFGVAPMDKWAVAAACAGMAVTALAAGYVPAARAARIDPAVTLRSD
jgi:predicted permease